MTTSGQNMFRIKGKAIPVQALRVPGGRGCQISRKYCWYSFIHLLFCCND
jgi:hypothetical protein